MEIRVDNRTPEWRAMLTKALALVAASAGGDADVDKPFYAEIIDADLELASRLELALNLADGAILVVRIAVDSYVDALNAARAPGLAGTATGTTGARGRSNRSR